MPKFKHTQGISEVSFSKTITVYCPLGRDYYTATIEVLFSPDEWMMDYIDVDKFIHSIQGQTLIIEDVVDKVYSHLIEEYSPKYVEVTLYAENAAHFPVVVKKKTTN